MDFWVNGAPSFIINLTQGFAELSPIKDVCRRIVMFLESCLEKGDISEEEHEAIIKKVHTLLMGPSGLPGRTMNDAQSLQWLKHILPSTLMQSAQDTIRIPESLLEDLAELTRVNSDRFLLRWMNWWMLYPEDDANSDSDMEDN